MIVKDLIQHLHSWIEGLSQQESEKDLHEKVAEKLKSMGRQFANQGKIENSGAGGVSRPDFLVTDVEPQLLIEIKRDGDWSRVAEAGWQLFQAAKLLESQGNTNCKKLAVFGGPLKDPNLAKFLQTLDVEWAEIR